MAHAKIVGYIRLMRRLYQLSNLPFRPKKRVKPEQKKNSASPIAPPCCQCFTTWIQYIHVAICDGQCCNAFQNINTYISLFHYVVYFPTLQFINLANCARYKSIYVFPFPRLDLLIKSDCQSNFLCLLISSKFSKRSDIFFAGIPPFIE